MSRPEPPPARPAIPCRWAARTPTAPAWPSSRPCAPAARCASGAPPRRPDGSCPSTQHALLAAARRAGTGPAWKEEYRRWRPPVERAIAWLAARGSRRVPYRGIPGNNAWLANRAAALNLRRLINLGLTRTADGNWALA